LPRLFFEALLLAAIMTTTASAKDRIGTIDFFAIRASTSNACGRHPLQGRRADSTVGKIRQDCQGSRG